MLWFHCDNTTGAIVTAGIGPEEIAHLQTAPTGQTLVVVPDGSVSNPFSEEPDFTVLKDYLRAKIDKDAGAFRARFITDVPGQSQTYEKKESECRAWTDGDEVANPDKYPFMIAEATVRGVPVAQVRAEIFAQVSMLTPLAALIEAHRVAAKTGVSNATTLLSVLQNAEVDWEGLLP